MNFGILLMIFILASFIGYYIIWGITPSLHAPLMSVSNAISGIIIIGAISVINTTTSFLLITISFIAIIVASINAFGGFAISQRMLQMFKTKPSHKDKTHEQ